MKTLIAATFLALLAAPALAQPDAAAPTPAPTTDPCTNPCAPGAAAKPDGEQPAQLPATVATATPTPIAPVADDDDTGWHRPAGKRFTSGFRLGWMYVARINDSTRMPDSNGYTTLAQQFGLKSPNMFLIGYEGFYRVVGHSWLNVLLVGNVTVAGLEQSKFIPTASGLLGFEFARQAELGVGINLLPDTQAPSHMIIAAGWTPRVGSIQTPIHFFYIPDPAGNSRTGATVGVNW